MEKQEKQEQEETDRHFAHLGAKHALQVVKADLSAADVRLAVARVQMDEAKREIKAADEQRTKAVRAVEAARSVVALLEPKKS